MEEDWESHAEPNIGYWNLSFISKYIFLLRGFSKLNIEGICSLSNLTFICEMRKFWFNKSPICWIISVYLTSQQSFQPELELSDTRQSHINTKKNFPRYLMQWENWILESCEQLAFSLRSHYMTLTRKKLALSILETLGSVSIWIIPALWPRWYLEESAAFS